MGILALDMMFNVLLLSTYEMGRQPFGLASPAAWLRRADFTVHVLDLAVESVDETAVAAANLIAFYVPMHMATRMAASLLPRIRRLNPTAHICFYGLYAPENAPYFHQMGVNSFLGGEFESGLVELARAVASGGELSIVNGQLSMVNERLDSQTGPPADSHTRTHANTHHATRISLDRQQFLVPDRTDLPDLNRYARLVTAEGYEVTAGYVEASRGCKHVCRHCPIVPVYNGRFRIIQPEVVLADIAQQVAAGAQHITFGDPDFFNGPGHAIPLVKALHERFPKLTYDVTIKVEHLRKQADLLPVLQATGCLFVTTAVESFDETILARFDKQHTQAEFDAVLAHCRQIGLLLVPTFVAFTPWTTLESYRHFLAELVRLELVEQVAPIQLAIRLLIPPGSRLLQLDEVQALVTELDPAKLSYQWRNPDPRLDALQQQLEELVQVCSKRGLSRRQIFQRVWSLAHRGTAVPSLPLANVPFPALLTPHLTEPWYC
jgi:radical SAM superfamily enzyme YgiQ (UPF0313 family)